MGLGLPAPAGVRLRMGNDLHRQAIAPCVGVVVNGTNGKSAMKRMRSLSPRPGSVVFVGSQVFQNWAALGKDMPGLPVVNVAYTGAMVSHLVKHAGDVLALKPRVLVWYCGNMDLEWGHKPVATFDAFRAALRALRKEEPTLPIVYVGTIVGPRHKDLGRGLVEKCHEPEPEHRESGANLASNRTRRCGRRAARQRRSTARLHL